MPAFPPLVDVLPHTLILGSMPSVISLREQQYYANPQNKFWWIMSELLGFSFSSSYRERATAITVKGFAVWDVLYECVRQGSADSNIQRDSEEPNDFSAFLEKYATIRLIAFNGKAARQIFMRNFGTTFLSDRDVKYCQLPSTSPAYAAMPPIEKLDQWRTALIKVKTV